MKNNRLQVTIREMLSKLFKYLAPLLLTSIIAGAILAILGPFGTHRFTLTGRFSYWISLCAAGGLGAGAAELLYTKFKQGDNETRPAGRWIIAVIQSIGATLLVSLFLSALYQPSNFADFALSVFYIWVIAMTISAVGALQKGRDKNTSNAAPNAPLITPSTAPPPPALLARLKPAFRRADIYALVAQDHYVRVITSEGDDLLLMRLSDAVSETSPLKGLSPHRSWWVAEAGVKSTQRRDGKTRLILRNGTSVPVSRNRLKTLKKESWV